MKHRFFVIKNFRRKIIVFTILLLFILLMLFLLVRDKNSSELSQLPEAINEIEAPMPHVEDNVQVQEVKQIAPVRDKSIPKTVGKYTVIGKLEIPKIKLTTYILGNLTKDSLKKSVAKFYGPNINEIGNFCIVGHNYDSKIMFGKLNDLKIGDALFLTGLYGDKKEYKVYDKFTIKPNDVKCLSQDTKGKREVTLITCTITSLKRVVVKAMEV